MTQVASAKSPFRVKSEPNCKADPATAFPSRTDHLNDLSDRQRSAKADEHPVSPRNQIYFRNYLGPRKNAHVADISRKRFYISFHSNVSPTSPILIWTKLKISFYALSSGLGFHTPGIKAGTCTAEFH